MKTLSIFLLHSGLNSVLATASPRTQMMPISNRSLAIYKPAPLAPRVTNSLNGSTGNAPGVKASIGIGSSNLHGFDAHGVFGISTKDGGFLTVGTGLNKDPGFAQSGAVEWSWSNFMSAYAWKVGSCPSYPQKDLMLPDAPNATGCGLQCQDP